MSPPETLCAPSIQTWSTAACPWPMDEHPSAGRATSERAARGPRSKELRGGGRRRLVVLARCVAFSITGAVPLHLAFRGLRYGTPSARQRADHASFLRCSVPGRPRYSGRGVAVLRPASSGAAIGAAAERGLRRRSLPASAREDRVHPRCASLRREVGRRRVALASERLALAARGLVRRASCDELCAVGDEASARWSPSVCPFDLARRPRPGGASAWFAGERRCWPRRGRGGRARRLGSRLTRLHGGCPPRQGSATCARPAVTDRSAGVTSARSSGWPCSARRRSPRGGCWRAPPESCCRRWGCSARSPAP